MLFATSSQLTTAHTENSLNLAPDEKRAFQYLFQQADTEKLGVITGEIAVKFFERTKLAPAVLGEIWQIADTENRGLLTMAGFCQVLRYQAGRDPSPELAFRRASYGPNRSRKR
jgi:epidermal growth factor receptor substrate 15